MITNKFVSSTCSIGVPFTNIFNRGLVFTENFVPNTMPFVCDNDYVNAALTLYYCLHRPSAAQQQQGEYWHQSVLKGKVQIYNLQFKHLADAFNPKRLTITGNTSL